MLCLEMPPHRPFPQVIKEEEVEFVLQLHSGPLSLPPLKHFHQCCSQCCRSLLIPPYYYEKFPMVIYRLHCAAIFSIMRHFHILGCTVVISCLSWEIPAFLTVLWCYLVHHEKFLNLMYDSLLLMQQALVMLLWLEVHPHRQVSQSSKEEEAELLLWLHYGMQRLPGLNFHHRCCSQCRSLQFPPYYDKKSDFSTNQMQKITFMGMLNNFVASFDWWW